MKIPVSGSKPELAPELIGGSIEYADLGMIAATIMCDVVDVGFSYLNELVFPAIAAVATQAV